MLEVIDGRGTTERPALRLPSAKFAKLKFFIIVPCKIVLVVMQPVFHVFRFALDSEPRGSKIKYFFFILDGTQAE